MGNFNSTNNVATVLPSPAFSGAVTTDVSLADSKIIYTGNTTETRGSISSSEILLKGPQSAAPSITFYNTDKSGSGLGYYFENVGNSGSSSQDSLVLVDAGFNSRMRFPDAGGMNSTRSVIASTAGSGSPNALVSAASRQVTTNEGTTVENYNNLPSAAAGLQFDFYCADTDGIRVVAASGDTIRIEASVSGTAGFIKSTVIGSYIKLVAINATEWVAAGKPAGTWTIDS